VDSIEDREKFLEAQVNPQILNIAFHLKISQFLPDQMITILQVKNPVFLIIFTWLFRSYYYPKKISQIFKKIVQ